MTIICASTVNDPHMVSPHSDTLAQLYFLSLISPLSRQSETIRSDSILPYMCTDVYNRYKINYLLMQELVIDSVFTILLFARMYTIDIPECRCCFSMARTMMETATVQSVF